MGSTYAGVLGFLAFAVTMIRGAIDGDSLAAATPPACAALAAFALVGMIAGKVADAAVLQSVEQNLRSEIEAYQRQATASMDGTPKPRRQGGA